MSPPPSRRTFLRRALAGGAALALGGVGVGVAQAHALQVNTHAARLPGLTRALRVALLTDLHYGPYVHAGQVRGWVEAALQARPDLLLVLGDFVDADLASSPTPLLAELARLRAPLGVWGVWGNHDYASFGQRARRFVNPQRANWMAVREEFRADLARAGVRVLRNEAVRVRDDLTLAGLDDLRTGAPDLAAALGAARPGGTLLMSHNPDVLPDVPAWVGLTVSGHTHGGQVRFPVVGAPVVPSAFGQRFAQGFVTGDLGARGFVSRGLGVSGVPVRNLCPPEVVVLDCTG
ncbi:metallophosphoesterase [Deinococcus maricopensis]|uniref:Metallophosphoesterase n=1 Tax=Deinococcus maricopensis (strain DSM 21211 / LMG 22137 / NRRL B-23946 / LB-34) TaxID=709986 RepID=E8U639_DEIML|nr:metallophosphoesterase [Deinococcus maricopensis]ADV66528.1 metallophosphoesterase [Deinococcus maricopensis DSM 21211]